MKKLVQLSLKSSTGYQSPDDFAANQRIAQDLLMDWHLKNYERDNQIPGSLAPFIREPDLVIASGMVPYPSDYRSRIQLRALYVSGTTTTLHRCVYLRGEEEGASQDSYVRRADASKRRFYYTITDTGFRILPETFNGAIRLKYVIQPANAVWAATLDAANVVYNYNAGSSTHFVWSAEDESALLDIFLYLKGIQTRTSELLTWVAQRNQLIAQK